ncbi:hypothetical protein [Marimonas arenosa]|uniref:Uncharacterized protein n=1 Tax=Marimonas arenosa TaxID=1795305 RepID=A0AAE4B5E6_9RHOB|nr:hypothetical protein [Marimonas arenosa]MDQ2091250.1 hypothetical protein [Marimonas arenosa]
MASAKPPKPAAPAPKPGPKTPAQPASQTRPKPIITDYASL